MTPPRAAPGRRHRQVHRRLALVGGLASILLIAVVVATATLSGEETADDSIPSTSSGTSTDTTVVDPPDTDPFAGLVVGETSGADAVAGLRAAGFVVFDYSVCSGSVPDAGLLRLVRVTQSGDELIGPGGVADAAGSLRPGAELDVLVTSGEPCG